MSSKKLNIVLYAICCILALYGLIILIRKLMLASHGVRQSKKELGMKFYIEPFKQKSDKQKSDEGMKKIVERVKKIDERIKKEREEMEEIENRRLQVYIEPFRQMSAKQKYDDCKNRGVDYFVCDSFYTRFCKNNPDDSDCKSFEEKQERRRKEREEIEEREKERMNKRK